MRTTRNSARQHTLLRRSSRNDPACQQKSHHTRGNLLAPDMERGAATENRRCLISVNGNPRSTSCNWRAGVHLPSLWTSEARNVLG